MAENRKRLQDIKEYDDNITIQHEDEDGKKYKLSIYPANDTQINGSTPFGLDITLQDTSKTYSMKIDRPDQKNRQDDQDYVLTVHRITDQIERQNVIKKVVKILNANEYDISDLKVETKDNNGIDKLYPAENLLNRGRSTTTIEPVKKIKVEQPEFDSQRHPDNPTLGPQYATTPPSNANRRAPMAVVEVVEPADAWCFTGFFKWIGDLFKKREIPNTVNNNLNAGRELDQRQAQDR